jgi:hypothetical protein
MNETKTYTIPILPAEPTTGLDNKKVDQAMIDSTLAYDPQYRRAYLYLNRNSAHGNETSHNAETVGEVLKTFLGEVDGKKFVMAEVKPNRVYEGAKFSEAMALYPMRSCDLWPQRLTPGAKTPWTLVSIALCGQQASALNLPAVALSAQRFQCSAVMQFSVSTNIELAESEKYVQENLPGLPDYYQDEAIQLCTRPAESRDTDFLEALKKHFGIAEKPIKQIVELAADAPKSMNDAINRFAAENKIDTTTLGGFERAEIGAMRKWAPLWRRNV